MQCNNERQNVCAERPDCQLYKNKGFEKFVRELNPVAKYQVADSMSKKLAENSTWCS
jgi:hypothetical protein